MHCPLLSHGISPSVNTCWTKDGPIPRPSDEELDRDLNKTKLPCPCPRLYKGRDKTWRKPKHHTRPDCLRRIALEYQKAHGGTYKQRTWDGTNTVLSPSKLVSTKVISSIHPQQGWIAAGAAY